MDTNSNNNLQVNTENKIPVSFSDLEIVEGYKFSKLDFLQIDPQYILCAVNFVHTKTKVLYGAFYVDLADEDGISSIFGYGLMGDYIGKGFGVEFFIKSFRFIVEKTGVNGLLLRKMTMNQFSHALFKKLKQHDELEITDEFDKNYGQEQYIIKFSEKFRRQR